MYNLYNVYVSILYITLYVHIHTYYTKQTGIFYHSSALSVQQNGYLCFPVSQYVSDVLSLCSTCLRVRMFCFCAPFSMLSFVPWNILKVKAKFQHRLGKDALFCDFWQVFSTKAGILGASNIKIHISSLKFNEVLSSMTEIKKN